MLYNEDGVLKFSGSAIGGSGGDFFGPASSVASNFVSFANTDGKTGADSGYSASSFALASHNQAASTINSGTLDGDRLPAASTSKKGAVPVLSNVATQYLNGQGAWGTPASGSVLPYVTIGPTGSGATYECDGTADDVQFNQAEDFCAASSTIKDILAFQGSYNLAAPIVNHQNVHLQGMGKAVGLLRGSAGGCVILQVSSQINAITVYQNSWIDNLAFYYPTQQTNSAPDSYPATIQLAVDGAVAPQDVSVTDCLAVNPYVFIDADLAHERLRVERCAGYPLSIGINIDHSTDIDYIIGNHWNPNYHNPGWGDNLIAWVKANGIGYKTGQADWHQYHYNFCWGYKYGLYATGATIYVVNCGFDCSAWGIYLNACENSIITGNYINGANNGISGSAGIAMVGACARVRIIDNFCVNNYAGITIASGSHDFIIDDNMCYPYGITDNSGAVNKVFNAGDNLLATG